MRWSPVEPFRWNASSHPCFPDPRTDLPTAHAQQPKWFKGNTHTHSLWSDGNDFPEMITDWYKRHGYNFLAISDHNILRRRRISSPMEPKISSSAREGSGAAESSPTAKRLLWFTTAQTE